jgi:hypothetical protein
MRTRHHVKVEVQTSQRRIPHAPALAEVREDVAGDAAEIEIVPKVVTPDVMTIWCLNRILKTNSLMKLAGAHPSLPKKLDRNVTTNQNHPDAALDNRVANEKTTMTRKSPVALALKAAQTMTTTETVIRIANQDDDVVDQAVVRKNQSNPSDPILTTTIGLMMSSSTT